MSCKKRDTVGVPNKKKRTKFKIKGLLYLQGESDGRTSSIADQRAEMLLKNLQKDLPNAQSMKMFIGGIGGFGKLKDLSRAKHEALAKKNKDIYFIKTSDLLQKGQYKDRLHFNNGVLQCFCKMSKTEPYILALKIGNLLSELSHNDCNQGISLQ